MPAFVKPGLNGMITRRLTRGSLDRRRCLNARRSRTNEGKKKEEDNGDTGRGHPDLYWLHSSFGPKRAFSRRQQTTSLNLARDRSKVVASLRTLLSLPQCAKLARFPRSAMSSGIRAADSEQTTPNCASGREDGGPTFCPKRPASSLENSECYYRYYRRYYCPGGVIMTPTEYGTLRDGVASRIIGRQVDRKSSHDGDDDVMANDGDKGL